MKIQQGQLVYFLMSYKHITEHESTRGCACNHGRPQTSFQGGGDTPKRHSFLQKKSKNTLHILASQALALSWHCGIVLGLRQEFVDPTKLDSKKYLSGRVGGWG